MKPLSEFPKPLTEALEAAKRVRGHSYSPYSGFKVGSAIVAKGGKVFAGCNVETVAYNNSLHAEMGAISSMVASGCQEFEAVVVVTDSDEPVFPCGFCLQYLSEFGCDVPVYAVNLRNENFNHRQLSELMPYQFQRHHLNAAHSEGEADE